MSQVTPDMIQWGAYKPKSGTHYEGPYFPGVIPYRLPMQASEEEKILYVLTTTEGGRFDAINGYDQCIMSGGLEQSCEEVGNLATLLGEIESAAPIATFLMHAHLDELGYGFGKVKGKWMFYQGSSLDNARPLTRDQKSTLFLGGTGLLGSWGDATNSRRRYAKVWASVLANVLGHPQALEVQTAHLTRKVYNWFSPFANAVFSTHPLFASDDHTPERARFRAAIAVYISFAANNSVKASEALEATAKKDYPIGSQVWLEDLCRQLTFLCGFTIYPIRYAKIRPVVENLYGVSLPVLSPSLPTSQSGTYTPVDLYSPDTVAGIQRLLIKLGYDLGPKGADGQIGKKTNAALAQFQQAHGLKVDSIVGPKTAAALVSAFKSLPLVNPG